MIHICMSAAGGGAIRCRFTYALYLLIACRAYHKLESLGPDDDDTAVSQELMELLGPDKVQFLQLVHQLIIAEEVMHVKQHV